MENLLSSLQGLVESGDSVLEKVKHRKFAEVGLVLQH